MRAPALALRLLPLKLESDPTSKANAVVHPGSSTLLVDLPPELLTAICALVDCRSVARCRSVCRLLRDVIDTSLELQYRIELVRDGMMDGGRPGSEPFSPSQQQQQWPYAWHSSSPSSHEASTSPTALLTISDRLARLRELRKAWRALNWTRCVTVPMPGPCCAYDLVGGVFCKTQPRARRGRGRAGAGAGAGAGFGNGWHGWLGVVDGDGIGNGVWVGNGHDGHGLGDGDEAAHVFGSRTMSATWLPGRYDQGRTVVRDDLGIPARDFAMDPSQDLMMLFKGGGEDAGLPIAGAFAGALELHIRTISTNQTHPEARVPVLCTPVLYPITSVFIQIVDDVVGMMYCVDPARPRITIWNWKTGNPVVDRSSGNLPPGTWDFSFIHSRALFVTTANGGGSLELFTFTCDRADAHPNGNAGSDSDSQPQPQPHHIPAPTSPLIHIATLRLPPVHPSVRVLSVCTHTGPFLSGCPPDKPFVASNDERIHVLTIQYVHLMTLDGPRTGPRVCVFVHNRTLEGYLERGAESGIGIVDPSAGVRTGMGEATKTTVVPWREWGRIHARMLPHVGTFQWLRYVHGQRVVMLLHTSEAGKSTLQVLDFNVRSAFGDDEDEEGVSVSASADVGHTDEGTSKESNENDDDADQSLRKTTLEYVNYPTRIMMPSVFIDVVESGLPYREARRDVRGDYSGMMIDDERLVGLKYPAFLTGDMKEIDVFTM